MKHICFSLFVLLLATVVGIWFLSPVRVISWATAKYFNFPPPRDYVESYELYVPSVDGVLLQTVHLFPVGAELTRAEFPTILIRTPYGVYASHGVLGLYAAVQAHYFASFGYHVILQNTRGRFNSSGEWNPTINERVDGFATLKWIKKQPWFNGKLGMAGSSYFGYTQFSVLGEDAPIALSASVPSITSPSFFGFSDKQGAPNLETSINWLFGCHEANAKDPSFFGSIWRYIRFKMDMKKLYYANISQSVPLIDADVQRYGYKLPEFRDLLVANDPKGTYWGPRDRTDKLTAVKPGSIHLIGGWYDIFLNDTIHTYDALVKLGKQPYLTVYGGSHRALEIAFSDVPLIWFDHLLKGYSTRLRKKPISVQINPTSEWLEFDSWPPSTFVHQFFLHPAGKIGASPLVGNNKEIYKYTFDPLEPTPILGGYLLGEGGAAENFPFITERQNVFKDMLIFIGPKFERDTTLAGRVQVKLFVSSSVAYTDFYVRLYDFIQDKNSSINVCEGFVKINNNANLQTGFVEAHVSFDESVYKFQVGHRLMLSLASGAHPLVPRNPGTGEHISTATTFLKAHQQIIVSPDHPSSFTFPVLSV